MGTSKTKSNMFYHPILLLLLALLAPRVVKSSFNNAHNFNIEQLVQIGTQRFEIKDGREREVAERRAEEDVRRRAAEYEHWKKTEKADWETRANEALQALEAKAMPAALLNSVDRGYIPRCNADTRKTLRARFIKWGRNSTVTERLLWLFGPAGVGKSAVAQPNNRSDPDAVIPTLVYQLALLLEPYRLVLGQLFKANPQILSQERASIFHQLITDCFFSDPPPSRPLTLLSYLCQQLQDIMAHRHLLIVLDGIDECKGRDAQCEFVKMIYACALRDRNTQFRWMLCSRPEPHLTATFAAMQNKAICLQKKLEVDDAEAQTDALRILETGFAEIRARDPFQFGPEWPKEDDIRFIARQASGHLGFVSFIIRFIGDIEHDDPDRKLEMCLHVLRTTSGISYDTNPFDSLDFLYTQILSDIPKDILVITKRVLGVLILYGNEKLTTIILANFLGLDRAAFYSSLQRLHSVLLIPFPEEAHQSPIKVYHASFFDYLSDRSRAREFFLDGGAVQLYVVGQWFEWLGHFSKEPPSPPPEPKWVPDLRSPTSIINDVCDYSFRNCWKALPLLPKASLADLRRKLKDFDFNLDYSRWNSDDDRRDFAYFFQWLLSSDIKSLAKLDRSHSASGRPAKRNEITITWDEKSPESFVRQFIHYPRAADYEALHVELRNHTKSIFHLVPSRYIQVSSQMREDDVIIVCMGELRSGTSNLINVLTGKPTDHEQPPHESGIFEARTIRALHPRDGRNIVLIDTTSLNFEALREKDHILRIAKLGPRPSGIIYLQPITSSLLEFSQNFDPLCRYSKTVPFVVVSTVWSMGLLCGSASNSEALPERETFMKELRLRTNAPNAIMHITHLTDQNPQAAWRVVDELICFVEANILRKLLDKKTTRMSLSVIKKAEPLSEALESIKVLFSQVGNEDNPELKNNLIQEARSRIKSITKEISGRTLMGKLIVRTLLPSRELRNMYP
ncbi:hypothetical protein NP233_g8500 [Leucocoprinus birnbaumii]|uniref:Nephrocystin 3-like N-terminal domain-containing protein n=1 Tax=Leucocoprinus birnbaumii TaxID=56174 RepID=A0AAD5YRU2_9AGAR|nr:hypothetical protein NP233_g8500 [Leucocoprinus birnbaumii]